MPMSIQPNFKFKIASKISLSTHDIQSLTLLYQPVIGSGAFSLYMTLATLPSKIEHAHHLLLQISDLSMKSLFEMRHRLEAAGLIDVYEADDRLTYMLKKPLSVDQFFSDGIMSAFLYVKVGAKDFGLMKQMLIADHEACIGAKISKRFDEVFDIKKLTRVPNDLVAQVYEEASIGVDLSVSFDYSAFASILLKKGIFQETITQDLLATLNELSFLYKLDVHELARVVFDATDPNGIVDYGKMKSLARTQFQLMSKGEHVQVVVKDEKSEELVTDPADRTEQAVISFLEQSPIDFLRFKSGGKPPVPADIKLVEWLYLDQGMMPGVVNVLVDYVLDYTDGKLPKQLVEKIAGEWQRQHVNTVQAAMDKVIKTFQKSSDYKKEQQKPIATRAHQLKKATRVEPIPDWLGQSNNNEKTDDGAKARVEQMKRAMMKKSDAMDSEMRSD